MPEENFWTLWCKGRLTEADTPTIWLGATPSGLISAHLRHPPMWHASVFRKITFQRNDLWAINLVRRFNSALSGEVKRSKSYVKVHGHRKKNCSKSGQCDLKWGLSSFLRLLRLTSGLSKMFKETYVNCRRSTSTRQMPLEYTEFMLNLK